jgi:hypothetical protein
MSDPGLGDITPCCRVVKLGDITPKKILDCLYVYPVRPLMMPTAREPSYTTATSPWWPHMRWCRSTTHVGRLPTINELQDTTHARKMWIPRFHQDTHVVGAETACHLIAQPAPHNHQLPQCQPSFIVGTKNTSNNVADCRSYYVTRIHPIWHPSQRQPSPPSYDHHTCVWVPQVQATW